MNNFIEAILITLSGFTNKIWNVGNTEDTQNIFHTSNFNRDISNFVSNVNNINFMLNENHFNRDSNNSNILKKYISIILKKYEMFKEQCNLINKLTKEECCISYDKININNKYMICNTCNKQYLFENINKWLKIQNTCPHCRQNWTSKTIYINKE